MKKTMWVFLYIKYNKFLSISLEHFVEQKPLISEEWSTMLVCVCVAHYSIKEEKFGEFLY